MRVTSTQKWVIGLIVTSIVAFIAGSFSVLLTSYLDQIAREQAKPNVYIMREECSATPLWGTRYIAFRGMIRNKGGSEEKSITKLIEVSYPFVHLETNTSTIERNIGDIRVGQTIMLSAPIIGPSVEYIRRCTITIKLKVIGESEVWDQTEFTESW